MHKTLIKNGQDGQSSATCVVICEDSRYALANYKGQVDLIITSPPYADARRRHYDSVHPDDFAQWVLTFHLANTAVDQLFDGTV